MLGARRAEQFRLAAKIRFASTGFEMLRFFERVSGLSRLLSDGGPRDPVRDLIRVESLASDHVGVCIAVIKLLVSL